MIEPGDRCRAYLSIVIFALCVGATGFLLADLPIGERDKKEESQFDLS